MMLNTNEPPKFGEWITISANNQPPESTAIIVATKSSSVMEMYYSKGIFQSISSNGAYRNSTKEVTHWMPMPNLPN